MSDRLFDILMETRKVGTIDDLADNAFVQSTKMFEMIEDIFDERTCDLLMKAWIRALKSKDYDKFLLVYKRHLKNRFM